MEMLKSSTAMCPVEQNCWEWARRYMGYCLCSNKDGVSLALGLISVMSWGVAEIPQFITNYKQKSTEGLSLAFLLTWIVGDLLNLFGCMLEPATLPTQFYIAILYTVASSILAAQTIYYGRFYQQLKSNKQRHEIEAAEKARKNSYGVGKKEIDYIKGQGKRNNYPASAPSSPIPLPARPCDVTPGAELYIMSARSLSMSYTPTIGSFPAHRNASDAELDPVRQPFLGEVNATQSAPTPNTKTMLCAVSFVTFFLGTLNIQKAENCELAKVFQNPRGLVKKVGRRLLQADGDSSLKISSIKSGGIGTFFGWGMAAVYMGGRLPQICLNMRRGDVEGLNPLMFLFALLGNSTYVASILLKSLDWSKINPNLPWLVDACGCLLLDTFIVIQFVYFRYRAPGIIEIKHVTAGS